MEEEGKSSWPFFDLHEKFLYSPGLQVILDL